MRNVARTTLAALLVASTPAMAKTWTIDYGSSSLSFSGTQSNQPFTGTFKKFQATIDFDSANLGASKIAANIDIASALTGNGDIDTSLPQSEWFDTKKFPQAEFTTTHIEADAQPNCYKATAMLTIKGIGKVVTLPFCLTQEGDSMRAKGQLVIGRSDFDVGTGQWASDATVAKPVTVTVDIVAK